MRQAVPGQAVRTEAVTETARLSQWRDNILQRADEIKARRVTGEDETISEARVLVRNYLMEDDAKLTLGAQRLKRLLAKAVVEAGRKEQER